MNSNELNEDMNFEDFLKQLNMSYSNYLLAIRSNIKNVTVFLKRKVKDKFINQFNIDILKCHRANIDIQYITNPYAVCSYLVSYINKDGRGMSKILRNVVDEIKNGNFSIKYKLNKIANKFMNAIEISAQEAAYTLLGLHMTDCSRDSVFIKTFPPEERVKILKPISELRRLNLKGTEIFQNSLITYYENRPLELENLCLADFAAYYNYSKRINNKNSLVLQNQLGYISKRKNPKIIQYRKYREIDEENYYRENLMLYTPWRIEEEDILIKNLQAEYNTHIQIINANRTKYNCLEINLSEYVQLLESENNEEENEETSLDEEFKIYSVQDTTNAEIEIFETQNNTNFNNFCLKIQLASDVDYYNLIRSLNTKQRNYLNHVVYQIKNNKIFNEFISGGAGTGKSTLIKAITESINRYYQTKPGNNDNIIKVLLTAPTGKASYNINGITLHTAFNLPLNQETGKNKPLSADLCNTFFSKYMHLKVIIIDEISMVGATMFQVLDARLKQIFKSQEPFGGISIICVGDLRQLQPVGDRWIFASNIKEVYQTIVGNFLWRLFKLYELEDIMRQKDNIEFARALNNLANSVLTENNKNLFKSRECELSDVPNNIIHLFSTNEKVNIYNNNKINDGHGEIFISIAEDTFSKKMTVNQKFNLQNYVKTINSTKTFGLIYELKLKINIQYMLTNNIDTEDGLVNGAVGI